MTPEKLATQFECEGGVFITAAERMAERLAACRGIVLDWDGVFNSGEKGPGAASGFSEADSMGLNMLRYALWRRQRELPIAAIISGESNPAAETFARRERFHVLFQGVRDKSLAIASLAQSHGLVASELICVFDDINDLSMASACGLRICVRRRASVLLLAYMIETRVCDYVTGRESGGNPIRESAELMLGLLGAFDVVVESRVAYDDAYRAYFDARQSVELAQPRLGLVDPPGNKP